MVSRPGVGECSRHYEKERQEKWPKVKEIVTKSLLFQVLKVFIFNLCVCMFVPVSTCTECSAHRGQEKASELQVAITSGCELGTKHRSSAVWALNQNLPNSFYNISPWAGEPAHNSEASDCSLREAEVRKNLCFVYKSLLHAQEVENTGKERERQPGLEGVRTTANLRLHHHITAVSFNIGALEDTRLVHEKLLEIVPVFHLFLLY